VDLLWDKSTKHLFVDGSIGIGVGVSTASQIFNVWGNFAIATSGETVIHSSAALPLNLFKHHASNTGGSLKFGSSRGTRSGPTAVIAGDNVGTILTSGYDGSAYDNTGFLRFRVESIAAGNIETYAFLKTSNTSAAQVEVMRWHDSGVGILGSALPTAPLDVNGDKIRVRTSKTPSSAGDTGNAGDICWDAGYVYICVAASTWKRAAIATWI